MKKHSHFWFGLVIYLLLCSLAFTPAVLAQQPDALQSPAPNFKLPVIKSKVVAEFCKRHRQARTLSFSAVLSTNAEDIQFGMATQTWYLVNARRPNQFMIQGGPAFQYEPMENGRRHPAYRSAGDNIGISDGKTQLQVNSLVHIYRLSAAPAAITQATADAFQAIDGVDALSDNLLAGYAPAPDENLTRLTPVLVFMRTEPPTDPKLANYILWKKLYFNAGTGELLRYSEFARMRDTGHEWEEERVDYDNWKFNPKLSASAFDTTPPRSTRTREELDKALKAAMTTKK